MKVKVIESEHKIIFEDMLEKFINKNKIKDIFFKSAMSVTGDYIRHYNYCAFVTYDDIESGFNIDSVVCTVGVDTTLDEGKAGGNDER